MTSFKKFTPSPSLTPSSSAASTSYFSTGASSLDSFLFAGHGIPNGSLVTLLPQSLSSSSYERLPLRSELALDEAWLMSLFLSVAKNGLTVGDSVIWIDAGLGSTHHHPLTFLQASEQSRKEKEAKLKGATALSSPSPSPSSSSSSSCSLSEPRSLSPVDTATKLKIAWRYGQPGTSTGLHPKSRPYEASQEQQPLAFENFHYYSMLDHRWSLADMLQKLKDQTRTMKRVRILIAHLESPVMASSPSCPNATRLLLELKRMMLVVNNPQSSKMMTLVSFFPGCSPDETIYSLSDFLLQRKQEQILKVIKTGRHPLHLNGWKPSACQSFWHVAATLATGSIDIMPLSLPPEGESSLAGNPSSMSGAAATGIASSNRGLRAVGPPPLASPSGHSHGGSSGLGCGSHVSSKQTSSSLDF